MNVYVHDADLFCEMCGIRRKYQLTKRGVEDSGDSNDFPQGPYPNGGGEADTPAHCGECGIFLENPLTKDGVEYVRERIEEPAQNAVTQLWHRFYQPYLD